jgi:NitT/TauT family transport system substrate-binding protein
MTLRRPTRRDLVRTGVAGAAGVALLRARPARAAPTLRLLLNWFAEAEHGGFFQAKATGLYDQAGIDVELMQGGPQVNTTQLLLAGAADITLAYDLQILSGVERGLPLRAIAASFQVDLLGIMAHPEATSLAQLKGHKIFVANSAYTSYWPWLKQKFGYTDDMAGPKGASLQTFFADPASAVGGYITSEPFVAQQRGQKVNFLLFSQEGWPAYTNPLLTTEAFLAANGPMVRPFLKASMEGWKSYLADPAPGNALIKAANPKMADDQLAFGLAKLREIKAVEGGDAGTMGLGIMTEARWRKTRDFMVAVDLLKADTDWRKAFTTDYIKDVNVTL